MEDVLTRHSSHPHHKLLSLPRLVPLSRSQQSAIKSVEHVLFSSAASKFIQQVVKSGQHLQICMETAKKRGSRP
eukprot:1137148-Pelagomonas_calceolata.AAC.7